MMHTIENLSRRSFLKGMVSAGALVLGARYYPKAVWAQGLPRDTHADLATFHPNVFVGIDTNGGMDSRSSLGDGNRYSYFSPARGRGRVGRRLEESKDRTGDRRPALRRSEHRRVSFDQKLLRYNAAGRRHRPLHARSGGRATMERQAGGVCDGTPRCLASANRTEIWATGSLPLAPLNCRFPNRNKQSHHSSRKAHGAISEKTCPATIWRRCAQETRCTAWTPA